MYISHESFQSAVLIILLSDIHLSKLHTNISISYLCLTPMIMIESFISEHESRIRFCFHVTLAPHYYHDANLPQSIGYMHFFRAYSVECMARVNSFPQLSVHAINCSLNLNFKRNLSLHAFNTYCKGYMGNSNACRTYSVDGVSNK